MYTAPPHRVFALLGNILKRCVTCTTSKLVGNLKFEKTHLGQRFLMTGRLLHWKRTNFELINTALYEQPRIPTHAMPYVFVTRHRFQTYLSFCNSMHTKPRTEKVKLRLVS